jgi:uncharacterized protein involved in exopolysaccharide biosynthesis
MLAPAIGERNDLGASLTSALGALGGLASVAGVTLGNANAETEEAIAVLQSRHFTEAFIEEMQLMPRIFADQWDAEKKQWRVPDDAKPTPSKTYRRFHRGIRSVLRDAKSGLVTMHIDWIDRHEAADWANMLVARLNAEMRGRAIENANASLGFLQKELEATAAIETREAINRLIEAQVRQRMLANVTSEYAFRVVDPALPPDRDDPIRPRKGLMVASGLALGWLVGVAFVLVRRRPRASK